MNSADRSPLRSAFLAPGLAGMTWKGDNPRERH